MESRPPAWAVLCAPSAPLPRPGEVSPVGADPRGGLVEGPRKSEPWDNEDTQRPVNFCRGGGGGGGSSRSRRCKAAATMPLPPSGPQHPLTFRGSP